MRNLDEILDKIESEHPHKVLGNSGSYSQYNEAWCDCLDRVRQELKGINDSYISMEERLKKVYGKCDGMLETIVNHLEKHEGVDIGKPGKVILLTDEDVDEWLKYKANRKKE